MDSREAQQEDDDVWETVEDVVTVADELEVPGAGPISTIMDANKMVNGGEKFFQGADDDNGVEMMQGYHDLVGGTAGALAGMNPLIGAFSLGFEGGDKLAERFMGDASGFTGLEEIPAEGWDDTPDLADVFKDSPLGDMVKDFEDHPVAETLDLLTDLNPLGLAVDGMEAVFGDFLPSFDDLIPSVNLADSAAKAQAEVYASYGLPMPVAEGAE